MRTWISYRVIISAVLLMFTFSAFSQSTGAGKDPRDSYPFDPSLAPFYHGVASGDPTASSVIIWTRVSPRDNWNFGIDVKWSIYEDAEGKNPV